MDNWQTIQELIKEINEELKALNDKPMAIDKYVGCIYCGEPKGDSLSCCGENHFEEMYDEE